MHVYIYSCMHTHVRVQIRHHAVIYHLLEDLGGLLVGLAPGVKETEVGGQAEVMQVGKMAGMGWGGWRGMGERDRAKLGAKMKCMEFEIRRKGKINEVCGELRCF